MDKEDVVDIYIYIYIYIYVCVDIYICMYIYIDRYTVEYYSAIKKNEILPFATMWMDLESIMLSEISQILCYHIYRI